MITRRNKIVKEILKARKSNAPVLNIILGEGRYLLCSRTKIEQLSENQISEITEDIQVIPVWMSDPEVYFARTEEYQKQIFEFVRKPPEYPLFIKFDNNKIMVK